MSDFTFNASLEGFRSELRCRFYGGEKPVNRYDLGSPEHHAFEMGIFAASEVNGPLDGICDCDDTTI